MFGHRGGSAFADVPTDNSPWDKDSSAAGSDLARDAGVNDIGRGTRGDTQQVGLFDSDDAADSSDFDDDFGADVGDFGGGDSA
jgi:hypothetical protein